MINLYSPNEIRIAEQQAMTDEIDEIALMYNAAVGIFEALPETDGNIGILCGKGNNAGDGYALAHLLHQNAMHPVLYQFSESMTPPSAHYFSMCVNDGIAVYRSINEHPFKQCALLVDCLFGIGFHGEITSPWKEIIIAANESGIPIVAADIPSGLNAHNGKGTQAICAHQTVAIGGFKYGHYLGRGRDLCGELWLAPIQLAPVGNVHVMEDEDFSNLFSPRPHDCHKGSFGIVALLGGSLSYSGAPKLSAMASAALRSGCGIARLAVPASIANGVLPYLLETTLCPMPCKDGFLTYDETSLKIAFQGASSGAVGMGMGQSSDHAEILTWILKNLSIPLVIDADGLNTLARSDLLDLLLSTQCTIVLTPHPKEFSRLCGYSVSDILDDPITYARRFAKKYGCILLLKGTSTIVTDGKDTLIVARGCGGMATAGSGDVLSGVIASVLAWSSLDPLFTVAAAAHLCGVAGEIAEEKIGSISMIASDTVSALPDALRSITSTY